MFSVIIPVYNGEKFIENAIESVFSQTVSDFELIIVNDGSYDNTEKVLEKYKDNEKITILTQKNQGVSVARNFGVSHSKGEYIAFLDADDVWHNNHLEVMRDLISRYPDAGLWGTFTRTELVNGETIENPEYFKDKGEDIYLENFLEEYYKDKNAKMFTVITTCVSREAFYKANGFPAGEKIGEDLELSLTISAHYGVALSKKATATYKKENSNATKTNSFDADWGFFKRAEELYGNMSESKKESLKSLMEWFSMRRMRHYLIDGKRSEAIKVYRKLNKQKISKKDLLINRFLLIMPTKLIRKIFEVRWRGRA